MVDKIDFDDLDSVLVALRDAQDSQMDLRRYAREADHFVNKRDGQWSPEDERRFRDKPRGTFDKVGPVVDQIAGEMESAEFTIRVSPAGGDASNDVAKTYDGIIRNIRNISNAEHTFNQSGRRMVTTGFDAWEVVQDYVDGNSFDQDLLIKKIPNAIDRVWLDPGSEEQDRRDATWGVVLQAVARPEFIKRWPDKNPVSVGDNRRHAIYFQKADNIMVGRILYKKKTQRELALMTNGAVYEMDDDFDSIADELDQAGITIKKTRTRDTFRVWSRLFSGDEWLTKEEETVFDFIPIVPVYGNFQISENKLIFRGVIDKLIDPQRFYNFLRSREMEEVALAPRAKYWMTKEQSEADTAKLGTMNTNTDPIQLYTHVDGQVPPLFQGGAQVNQGLQVAAQAVSADLNAAAGLFASNLGDNPGLQSGVAIGKQIDKGDNGTIKWFESMEVAICHTARILINAIPRVYDSERQIRLIGEDGTSTTSTLYEKIIDEQTGKVVELNDLGQGQYDAVCEMGPAFKSRQSETAQAFLEMAGIDPSIAQKGMDIWLRNLNAPGMDLMAERSRLELIDAGTVPESQLTDEERRQIQQHEAEAAQQPPEPTAEMIAAQGELLRGQAEQAQAQNKQVEIQGNQQIQTANIQLENRKVDLREQEIQLDVAKFQREKDDKFNVDAAKIQQEDRKLDQSETQLTITAQQNQQKIDMQEDSQRINQVLDRMKLQQDQINDAFSNLKTMREAMGVDAIVGPHATKSYIDQAVIVDDVQEGVAERPEITPVAPGLNGEDVVT